MTHECAWEGCNKQIPTSMLLCLSHWSRLSYEDKQRAYAAYGRWKGGHINADELRYIQSDLLKRYRSSMS